MGPKLPDSAALPLFSHYYHRLPNEDGFQPPRSRIRLAFLSRRFLKLLMYKLDNEAIVMAEICEYFGQIWIRPSFCRTATVEFRNELALISLLRMFAVPNFLDSTFRIQLTVSVSSTVDIVPYFQRVRSVLDVVKERKIPMDLLAFCPTSVLEFIFDWLGADAALLRRFWCSEDVAPLIGPHWRRGMPPIERTRVSFRPLVSSLMRIPTRELTIHGYPLHELAEDQSYEPNPQIERFCMAVELSDFTLWEELRSALLAIRSVNPNMRIQFVAMENCRPRYETMWPESWEVAAAIHNGMLNSIKRLADLGTELSMNIESIMFTFAYLVGVEVCDDETLNEILPNFGDSPAFCIVDKNPSAIGCTPTTYTVCFPVDVDYNGTRIIFRGQEPPGARIGFGREPYL